MATNRDNSQDPELQQSRLTAYALGQLADEHREQVEAGLTNDAEARRTVIEIQLLSRTLVEANEREELPPASAELRQAVSQRLGGDNNIVPARPDDLESPVASRRRGWSGIVLSICLLIAAVPVILYLSIEKQADREAAIRTVEKATHSRDGDAFSTNGVKSQFTSESFRSDDVGLESNAEDPPAYGPAGGYASGGNTSGAAPTSSVRHGAAGSTGYATTEPGRPSLGQPLTAPAKPDTSYGSGRSAEVPRVAAGSDRSSGYGGLGHGVTESDFYGGDPGEPAGDYGSPGVNAGSEQYEQIVENEFMPVNEQHARSTFSIDVDTASYANVRRFLNRNMLPPPNAVRIEEMVNYFRYDYPQPEGDIPFSVNMEVAECPWQPSHRLLRVGLKGREIEHDDRPASNIVFLLDVSGSMRSPDKLPLLQQAMKMLVREMTENDRITVVTYASNAGLRLDATSGDQQEKIIGFIDSLTAGGSTHGSAGIKLAYDKAVENFVDKGTNRVILATDGDLNVGITGDDALVKLIQEKARSGVFLTVLGFGTGNLKDSKMEKLADNGNGMYAYIDSLREARKVLVEQIAGSLVTIAKDVKIQIEFNPAEVESYRLIGYENRLLAREDFDDDTKDAGEIGAGHTVTALYELVPAGAGAEVAGGGSDLKYQKPGQQPARKPAELTDAAESGELLTLWLRYKQPDSDTSRRLEFALEDGDAKFNRASHEFQFAACVAAFGMQLRGSEHSGSFSYSAIQEIASSSIGNDPKGYRAEFVDLVRKAEQLRR